jgi:hypothetical protein
MCCLLSYTAAEEKSGYMKNNTTQAPLRSVLPTILAVEKQ